MDGLFIGRPLLDKDSMTREARVTLREASAVATKWRICSGGWREGRKFVLSTSLSYKRSYVLVTVAS